MTAVSSEEVWAVEWEVTGKTEGEEGPEDTDGGGGPGQWVFSPLEARGLFSSLQR